MRADTLVQTHSSRASTHANKMCAKCVVTHAGSWKFNDQEQLILEFDEPITTPNVSFAVHFNYTLKQGLSGYYRSSYQCEALLPSCSDVSIRAQMSPIAAKG